MHHADISSSVLQRHVQNKVNTVLSLGTFHPSGDSRGLPGSPLLSVNQSRLGKGYPSCCNKELYRRTRKSAGFMGSAWEA